MHWLPITEAEITQVFDSKRRRTAGIGPAVLQKRENLGCPLADRNEVYLLDDLLTGEAEREVQELRNIRISREAVGQVVERTCKWVLGIVRKESINRDDLNAGSLDVSEAYISDSIRVIRDFGSDLLITRHFLGVDRIFAAVHSEFLKHRVGPGGGVAGVARDLTGLSGHRSPIGDVTRENRFDLLEADLGDRVGLVDDDPDSVESDGGLHDVDAVGFCLGHFRGLYIAAGHTDSGRAVDDRCNPGGGSFSSNCEVHGRVLRLKGFCDLRNHLGAESVGPLDHDGVCHRRGKSEPSCQPNGAEEFEFLIHSLSILVFEYQ